MKTAFYCFLDEVYSSFRGEKERKNWKGKKKGGRATPFTFRRGGKKGGKKRGFSLNLCEEKAKALWGGGGVYKEFSPVLEGRRE